MTEPTADKPLIAYASHAAHGTGRTPIGIIMFASSHLLLGGVLAFAAIVIAQRMRQYAQAAGEAYVPLLILLAAAPMLAGGLALLLKGLRAWTIAIVSFSILAFFEALTITYASGMTVRYLREGNNDAVWAVSFLVLSLCLGLLCATVAGYLAGSKARATFALPPGETPRLLRVVPRVVLLGLVVGLCAGTLLARVRWLYPD